MKTKNLVIVALLPLIIMLNVATTSAKENPKASGYASINGIKMYYELYGKGGTPLVLIHGGGSTIQTSFGEILPMLAKHHTIIAVELQAHGHTSDRDAPETFEQDADDVAALLQYLKMGKADIMGFSNGATTTLQMAIRHPEMVNKIVEVSGFYRRDGLVNGFWDGFAKATLNNMPEALREGFLKETPDSSKLLNMFHKEVAKMKAFTDIPDEMIQAIKVPALVIVNDHDVITADHAVRTAHTIPNARLIILLGHHGSSIGAAESAGGQKNKEPEMTATLIDDFLAGNLEQ